MTSESPIIGWRRINLSQLVEVPQVEALKIGDRLPDDYRQVIDELKAASKCEAFADQAEQTVYYLYALENNKSLTDEAGNLIDTSKFADLLSSLPLVSLFYVNSERNQRSDRTGEIEILSRKPLSLGSPDTSFPAWLRSRYEQRTPILAEAPRLKAFYEKYCLDYAQSAEDRRHGTYAQFSKDVCPEKSEKEDAYFKGYVEVEAEESLLEAVFQSLRQQKIHPHETKLFDDSRIVMYWATEPNPVLLDAIQNTFRTHRVPLRGPGEDSQFLVRDAKEEIKLETRASNDKALGEGGDGVKFAQETYSPIQFIKNYLNQCYRYWRNPLNPYQTSFMPAFDKSGGDVNELKNQQERVSKKLVPMESWVPVLFSNHTTTVLR